MRKTTLQAICALLLPIALLPSCVKNRLYDTAHPDQGKIQVTADWSHRGQGIAVPEEWCLSIGGYSGKESGLVHTPDTLFNPGTYLMTACNLPERVSISGTNATLESLSDSTGAYVASLPGWLFTNAQNVSIEADKEHALTAPMQQQIRQLSLIIGAEDGLADKIGSISGQLSGVARSLDFNTQEHKEASNARMEFHQLSSGPNTGKWMVTVRLLGITGNEQNLSATITYKDPGRQPLSLESCLSAALKDFNLDKTQPLFLEGSLKESGFSATIDDWTPAQGWEDIEVQ